MAFPSEIRSVTLDEHDAADVIRTSRPFEVVSPHRPAGDQPDAIRALEAHVRAGATDTVLLGATGTGKSATTAWLIEKLQRPTLVLAPNKTLAAQMASELRELFPHNAVEYFVSFYDYYRPESYQPSTDSYFQKEAVTNREIDRLRHSAMWSLLSRRDVIVVASVSCIYGLGTPQSYLDRSVQLAVGQQVDRDELVAALTEIEYVRTDLGLAPGMFRSRGDVLDVQPAYETSGLRIRFSGSTVTGFSRLDDDLGEGPLPSQLRLFPARHYTATPERMRAAAESIENELHQRVGELHATGRALEAERLTARTERDVDRIRQSRQALGMENYSRHLDGRAPGAPPATLLDYFPDDLLVVIDESHVTVPQLGGMSVGDAARKRTLVEHGFRLPSCLDNRPLTWDEFAARAPQRVYLSATPGAFERAKAGDAVVEQIIRPTGLVDPEVEIRPKADAFEDLVEQIRARAERDERVLVTTLTKRSAEELAAHLEAEGIRARSLHADVKTLDRVELLAGLRRGEFDALIGINLLREGLDLPEVSLVSILDADHEGAFRSETALVQMIGRAARNVRGEVHMYADRMTRAMALAIDETNRRRSLQQARNRQAGIVPAPLVKRIGSLTADYAQGQHPTTGTSYNRRMAAG